ncbi:MAG: hypothetical protein GX556_06090 [Fibrobacter sp.]|nr:hypothetical protein [Fibrobacter sp.]
MYNLVRSSGIPLLKGSAGLLSTNWDLFNCRVLRFLRLQSISALFKFRVSAESRNTLFLNDLVVKLVGSSAECVCFVFGLIAIPPNECIAGDFITSNSILFGR